MQRPRTAEGGGHGRTDHDADVGETRLVGQYGAGEHLRVAGLPPPGPVLGVAAQRAHQLRTPQAERTRDAPGATGHRQDAGPEDGQHQGAGGQRPGPPEGPYRRGAGRGDRSEGRRVAAGLDASGDEDDEKQRGDRHRPRTGPADVFGEDDRLPRGKVLPEVELPGGERGARDEPAEGQEHGGLPRAHGEEGAGGAGTAELHPDGEEQGPDDQSDPDRPCGRRGLGAEQSGAAADEQREQRGGGTEQQSVRPQAGAVADGDELTPGGGEAEPRVEEGDAQTEPEQEQYAGFRPVCRPDVRGQGDGEQPGHDERRPAHRGQ